MKIKKTIFVVIIYFLSLNNLYSIEPDIFVQSTVNRASKTLSENLTKKEKIDELKKIALVCFFSCLWIIVVYTIF